MNERREFCERLIVAGNLKFKNFRGDFDKLSVKASKMGRAEFFFDQDWDLRTVLQRRYANAGAFDAIASYHANRFKRVLGRNTAWPDEAAHGALKLFVEHGAADKGVALIRAYLDMQHKRLKRDYSARNPRRSRKPRDENTEGLLGIINTVIAEKIPEGKRLLMRDMEAVAPYIEAHGKVEDCAWFDALRREIWMEKRA